MNSSNRKVGNQCLAGQSAVVSIGGHVAQRCMWEVKESEREIG